MRHAHRTRRLIGALGVAGLVLTAAGCGGGGGDNAQAQKDPKQAVQDAVAQMADYDGMSMTLSVDSDKDSLMAAGQGSDALTADQAQTVLDSSLRIAGTNGGTADDTSDDEVEVSAKVGDIDAFDLRYLGKDLYLRAAVQDLIQKFDTSGTAADSVQQAISQAQAMGLDFVDAAVQGKWLHITGLEQLMSMFSGLASEQPSVAPSEAEQLSRQISDAFQQMVDQDVEATFVGDEDAGQHIQMKVPGKAIEDFAKQAGDAASSLVPGGAGQLDSAMGDLQSSDQQLADTTIPVEMWIKDGKVSQIGFDVVQFAQMNPDMGSEFPSGIKKLVVLAQMSEFSGGVDAPSDAVDVDLFKILGQFGGALGGSGLSG